MRRVVSRSQSYKDQINRKQWCNGDDRVDYKESERLDDLKPKHKYDNPNQNNSHCDCGNDKAERHTTQPKTPPVHQIVNLCQPYIESVFFQYDSFPHTDSSIEFNNDKKGRIIKFIYYLDSSAGDAVTCYPELIKANKQATSLLNYVAGGNQKILGTFNSTVLEFQLNMKIENDEKIRLTFVNASANDVTIMATCDIKYGEEDFNGTNN